MSKHVFTDIEHLDQKAVAFLLKAIQENNLKGFDYYEFKESMNSLQQMNMDRETSIKSAYATASTIGLTKDNLIKSANHYKKVLDQEKREFNTALDKRMNERVNSKRQEKQVLQEKVKKGKQQLIQLEKQIKEFQQQLESMDETVAAEKERIEATEAKFEQTYQYLVKEIESDIQQFRTILPS